MMKLFGKLFQQSVILSANKVHEIFYFEFSSNTSSHWNTSQREHIILTSLTRPSTLAIPCSVDTLFSFD